MHKKFTQAFKLQAVEKALRRSETTNLTETAEFLGVGYSTLQKWIAQSRNQESIFVSNDKLSGKEDMTKEKRPQDWGLSEKLDMVITCASLGEEAISKLCREKGVYPHHVKQWKLELITNNKLNNRVNTQTEANNLRRENHVLKKDLNRKNRALAEAAALLVLQKKVCAIWVNDEDNLR